MSGPGAGQRGENVKIGGYVSECRRKRLSGLSKLRKNQFSF